jgi:hypothetical protein
MEVAKNRSSVQQRQSLNRHERFRILSGGNRSEGAELLPGFEEPAIIVRFGASSDTRTLKKNPSVWYALAEYKVTNYPYMENTPPLWMRREPSALKSGLTIS